jgi:hypothetical protein
MSATEHGLYVYNVTYTDGAPSFTIDSQVTDGTNHGRTTIRAPSNVLSDLDTGAPGASVNNVTLQTQNKFIGTVNLPNGVQGFLVQDVGTQQYSIYTTSRLPRADVGHSVSATVNISTTPNNSGPGSASDWDIVNHHPHHPCFLAGSHIRTPSGDVVVESLQAGDMVITLEDGAEIARPVVWVGHRSVKPGDISGDDAHPVRIIAGAFADGIPARDLLVTAEHCIYAGGGLIPARMLVNGSTIISDTGISSFTYYHVELAAHGILLAEGLATESYLDTGNRGNFANAEITALRPNLAINPADKSWGDAAAPLLVDRESVEPVWQALADRAASLGILAGRAPRLSTDPALHLAAADGSVIRPLQMRDGKAVFMVPPGVGALTLVSNTARPCDTLAPFIDDRRALGVLVGEIILHNGRRKDAVKAHLMVDQLPGWFAPEAEDRRWTNGNASLPVAISGLTRPAILEIEILGAGPYLAMPGQAAA